MLWSVRSVLAGGVTRGCLFPAPFPQHVGGQRAAEGGSPAAGVSGGQGGLSPLCRRVATHREGSPCQKPLSSERLEALCKFN